MLKSKKWNQTGLKSPPDSIKYLFLVTSRPAAAWFCDGSLDAMLHNNMGHNIRKMNAELVTCESKHIHAGMLKYILRSMHTEIAVHL